MRLYPEPAISVGHVHLDVQPKAVGRRAARRAFVRQVGVRRSPIMANAEEDRLKISVLKIPASTAASAVTYTILWDFPKVLLATVMRDRVTCTRGELFLAIATVGEWLNNLQKDRSMRFEQFGQLFADPGERSGDPVLLSLTMRDADSEA